MPLPSSGTITMAQINTEFGRGNNLNSYRGTTYYTSSGGPFTFSSGAISFSNFYGTQATSPTFSFSISAHQANANLRSLAVAAGWNQSSAVVATLTGGYYIYSTAVGTPALTIDGSWPGGVTFVNNGYVMGMGGQGGGYNSVSGPTSNYLQSAGGPAINLGVSCTIQNNSYIGGGGGGGGPMNSTIGTGGGGAGGGAGGTMVVSGGTFYGGSGGGIGSNGAAGDSANGPTGGGGGRIMPGSNTTLSYASGGGAMTSTGGGGGNAGSSSSSGAFTASTPLFGGLGGSGGGTGGMYTFAYTGPIPYVGGGGGGWGASGGNASGGNGSSIVPLAGSAGGKCVNLNGYSLTWSATGTRYGAIS